MARATNPMVAEVVAGARRLLETMHPGLMWEISATPRREEAEVDAPSPVVLTVREAAERERCSPEIIRQAIRDGHLEAMTLNSDAVTPRYRLTESALEAWRGWRAQPRTRPRPRYGGRALMPGRGVGHGSYPVDKDGYGVPGTYPSRSSSRSTAPSG